MFFLPLHFLLTDPPFAVQQFILFPVKTVPFSFQIVSFSFQLPLLVFQLLPFRFKFFLQSLFNLIRGLLALQKSLFFQLFRLDNGSFR